MEKRQRKRIPLKQAGGITDKQDKNAGSGAFNQGSVQDEHMNEGVADGTPNPEEVSEEKENPKSRNSVKDDNGRSGGPAS
jgi:hypothetical protein